MSKSERKSLWKQDETSSCMGCPHAFARLGRELPRSRQPEQSTALEYKGLPPKCLLSLPSKHPLANRWLRYKGLEETASDYVAACPRYLGRTPSYIEFGEAPDASVSHLPRRDPPEKGRQRHWSESNPLLPDHRWIRRRRTRTSQGPTSACAMRSRRPSGKDVNSEPSDCSEGLRRGQP